MNGKSYNKTNFFKHTFCVFTEVASNEVSAIQTNYKSKSGSSYYFTEEGVYRYSNHWGRAANCRWRLLPLATTDGTRERIGYAKWSDFYPNNDSDNLFYITVDFTSGAAVFEHKSNPLYDGKAVLRNAAETTKYIQQIRKLFENEAWAKYLEYEDLNALRETIINELLTTNKTLQQIKSRLLI